ncbi:MAG: hypothetical protein J5752_00845 [Clostridiales bacterium]|nr:hypothetical protein [Clostridiales bacterium]
MAKQTRLATTLTARYFPTAELTDAFYMDGRVTSKTTARSADLTNDKEDRGFFFSIFSHQTNPDYDPNMLPPYEPVLRRLGTELKSGRRSLDDQIGEMVNTATSITGRMKIQQDNARAPFFAGVIVKDAEAFAITIGKGLAFLYRDDTLYPMTAADIRIDAINTQRQKVDNFFNFCATKTAPALCSNIAQLKLDDCIILCNREVYEALGQQELLRILYDAEDQSDAASVVMTEAAAKLPGVPLQFMISFVEDITSSDRGGFFGFGKKKKKAAQEEEQIDDYDIAPAIPLESPKKEEKPLPKDALLFEDEDVAPKKEPEKKPTVPEQPKVPQTTVTDKTERRRINTFASQVAAQVNAAQGASSAAGAAAAGAGAAAVAAGAASASQAAGAAKSGADAVQAAIDTPIPEPPLVFGDIHDLMKEEANGGVAPFTSSTPAPAAPKAPVEPAKPAAPTISSLVDDGATKVLPVVDAKASSLPSFGDTGIVPAAPATPAPAASPFVQPKTPPTPVLKDVTEVQPVVSAPVSAPAAPVEPKKEEPFVAVKNSENPFFKAAVKAQNEENKVNTEPKQVEVAKAEPANVSFEVGGDAPKAESSEVSGKSDAKDEAPLFLGDDPFGGIVATEKAEPAKLEQAPEEKKEVVSASSDTVAETDESIPLVFEADDEVTAPMNNESENDPKKFDETPLFFGDADTSADEEPESHLEYPEDYQPASSIPAPQQPEPAVSDDFVIPFASNDIPQAAQASADDIPEMPIYEAPTYTPPTYPTNSDTPIGYEDTGVYARGSYTVDEDDFTGGANAGTPISPFVVDGAAPSFGDSAGFTAPSVEPAPVVDDQYAAPQYGQPEAAPDYQSAAEEVNSYTAFSEPGDFQTSDYGAPAADDGEGAQDQYDFDNPPPAVADLFDFTPSGRSSDDYGAGAASSVPAYMQQGSVSSNEVPGVPKRQPNSEYRRPGGRPNVAPPRRRVEEVDDGFDDEEGEETNYLPFILAGISLICLIVIIVLIVHSCGSSKKKPAETTVPPTSIEETSDTSATEATTTTAAETTAAPDDAPLGVYTFSDKSGCRTWWDLFYHVYGIKIENESDKRVAFIKEYNNLDSSFKPEPGKQVKLPPAVMLPQV